jgi:CO/xanthine dehydrogenase Mo-binding subunit
MTTVELSRRNFIKTAAATSVAVKVGFIGARAKAANAHDMGLETSPGWIAPDGNPRYAVDAFARVTGEKVFGRDFRGADLPGWPNEQSHAFFILGTKADRAFDGVDLSVLGADLQPDRLVVAEDLVRDGVHMPDPKWYGEVLLVAKGATAPMLGHPVALLIYRDFVRYDAARRLVRSSDRIVRYGAVTGPKTLPHYGLWRYVRVLEDMPDPEGREAPKLEALVLGKFEGDTHVWPKPDPNGPPPAKAMAAAGDIARDVAAAGDDSLVLQRDFFSQSTDGTPMDTDSGLAWFDAAKRVLHLVAATQSPYEGAELAAEMVAKTKFDVRGVDFKVTPTVVGYGSKETAPFPYFTVVAGLYAEGRPVRLVLDRFQQFQMGLKRHAFWMKDTIVANRKSGKFKIFKAEFHTDGGGRESVTPRVALAATTEAMSMYHFPKGEVATAALASRAIEAGSLRGFGRIQSQSATEMLVDEAAERLGIDAIELRLRNLRTVGTKNVPDDAPAMRNEEVLRKARAHPLWAERKERKAAFEAANPGKKYGVGFASVQRGFGFPFEAAAALLAIDENGRVTLRHVATELGQGATTSQAVIVGKILGRAPDRIEFSAVEWPELPMTSVSSDYMSQDKQDKGQTDPRWTPLFTTGSSASKGAHYFGQATREAATVLRRYGLWPAALAVWSKTAPTGAVPSLRYEDARLVDGRLTVQNYEPLPIERLAAMAHALGLVTGVAVHTFNRRRGNWAEAVFDIPGTGPTKLALDGLSLQYGSGAPADRKALMTANGYHFIARSSVTYPRVFGPTSLSGDRRIARRTRGRHKDGQSRSALASLDPGMRQPDRPAVGVESAPGRHRHGHRSRSLRISAAL